MSEETHQGQHPGGFGMTSHKGPRETCHAPDCEAFWDEQAAQDGENYRRFRLGTEETVLPVRFEDPDEFTRYLESLGLIMAWACSRHPGEDPGTDGGCRACAAERIPEASWQNRHDFMVRVVKAFGIKAWQHGANSFACSCHPGPMPGMAEYHRRRKHRNRRRR